MSETALLVENLSKEYSIGKSSQLTLQETLSGFWKTSQETSKSFLALDDVSFEIKRGESVGIIGKNGAGKSTLLKILSRITKPTKGRIVTYGRVASLLEVGTGFHPELTGRENIFLNGTMLGLSRKELRAKFDEIVDFSGVEKFIDTPVKRYSSGMYVRLAFSVAAHLEPDILIVDEVLAVGDMAFQRKCINNLNAVAHQGRTVLFVSHNHAQLKHLCTAGIMLEAGKMLFKGNVNEAIALYAGVGSKALEIDTQNMPRAGGRNENFTITKVQIKNLSRPNSSDFFERDELEITMNFEVKEVFNELLLGFSITDTLNNRLLESRSTSQYPALEPIMPGKYKVSARFKIPFESNEYTLNVGARSLEGFLEYIPGLASLEVQPLRDFEEWKKPNAGIFLLDANWELSPNDTIE
jgi:lipopolysaccharide transport system ATP-binding protein